MTMRRVGKAFINEGCQIGSTTPSSRSSTTSGLGRVLLGRHRGYQEENRGGAQDAEKEGGGEKFRASGMVGAF